MTEPKPINRELGPAYQAYSKPFDLDTAVLQFESRYGHPPAEIVEDKYYLMLGPAPEKQIELED